MKKFNTILLLFFLLIGCEQRKNTFAGNDKKGNTEQAGGKQQAVAAAIQKYGIQYSWDSLNSLKYSSADFYNNVIHSGYQLITDYDITVVHDEDSVYRLVISCGSTREFFLKLTAPKTWIDQQTIEQPSPAGIILPGYPALVVQVDQFNREYATGTGEIIELVR